MVTGTGKAQALIVGMLAGTYSSVLLSGQVWAMWEKKRADKRAAKSAKA